WERQPREGKRRVPRGELRVDGRRRCARRGRGTGDGDALEQTTYDARCPYKKEGLHAASSLLISRMPTKPAYSTGINTSVKAVAVESPPITAIAIGRSISDPEPNPTASGKRPAIAARVVITIGRNRVRPASHRA